MRDAGREDECLSSESEYFSGSGDEASGESGAEVDSDVPMMSPEPLGRVSPEDHINHDRYVL